MKILYLLAAAMSLCAPAAAQTIDDGIMMTARSLQAGGIYSRDNWDQYWEGALKRVNGNIGTVTTESATGVATYGLTDRWSARSRSSGPPPVKACSRVRKAFRT